MLVRGVVHLLGEGHSFIALRFGTCISEPSSGGWTLYKEVWCMALSCRHALCSNDAFRLSAWDKGLSLANVNRFNHLGLKHFPYRSTLSDANKRRDSEIFGSIYMNLYEKYRHELYSDSRNCGQPKWLKNLKIIDSTTISLFSNLVFKGVGRNPKLVRKRVDKKYIQRYLPMRMFQGDIKFTSAASHDQFALIPERYAKWGTDCFWQGLYQLWKVLRTHAKRRYICN